MASNTLQINAGYWGCTLQHAPQLWHKARKQNVACGGAHFYMGYGASMAQLFMGSRTRHGGYTAFATTCKRFAMAVKTQWGTGYYKASIRSGRGVRVVYVICKGAANPVALAYAYAAQLGSTVVNVW